MPVTESTISESLAPMYQYSPVINGNDGCVKHIVTITTVCLADLEGDILEQSIFQHRLHFAVHLHREFKVYVITVISSSGEDGGHDSSPAGMAYFVLVTGGRGQCTSLFPHDEILDNSTMICIEIVQL